jgi:hypothetical protein
MAPPFVELVPSPPSPKGRWDERFDHYRNSTLDLDFMHCLTQTVFGFSLGSFPEGEGRVIVPPWGG